MIDNDIAGPQKEGKFMIDNSKEIFLSRLDFWYFTIGCNTIAVRSNKKPKIEWSEFQDKAMSKDDYELRKARGEYDDGCAVITGRLWRGPNKDKYLVCLDFDNTIAIHLFLITTFSLLRCKTLEELSEKTIVEDHEDAKGKKALVYIITVNPITKRNRPRGNKTMDEKEIPEIEVKSDGSTYAVWSPTIHKDGYPYKIRGTDKPLVLNDQQSKDLEKQIVRIYETYNPNVTNINSNLPPELRLVAKTLQVGKNPTKISEGCRSNIMISLVRIVLNYHYKKKDIQDIRDFVGE